jgi:steroid delta-isomerase-like uncharacterized protein
MRKLLVGSVVACAVLLSACDEKSNGTTATPAANATPNAAASGASSAASITAAAAPKPAVEAPKDHAARAKALTEAFATHDAKKVAALYAENAVVKSRGMPELSGRAAIEKDIDHMFTIFKDAKLMTGRIWAKDKHTAVIETAFAGTNTGEAPEMGLPKATNKSVGVSGATWLDVGDDGLIREERRYHDGPTALGQLNPDPKMPVRPVVNEPPAGSTVFEAKGTADEAKNIDLENQWVAAINAGKIDDAMKLTTAETSIEDYTQPSIVKGQKAFKDYLGMYLKAFPDLKASIVNAFPVGDYAVVEFRYTGTNKGPLGKTKPTNKSVDMQQVEVDEIKDGHFAHEWAWGNSAEMLGELGLMPAPAAAGGAVPGTTSK